MRPYPWSELPRVNAHDVEHSGTLRPIDLRQISRYAARHVAIRIPLSAARVVLTPDEASVLAPGDVVVFARHALSGSAPARLRLSRHGALPMHLDADGCWTAQLMKEERMDYETLETMQLVAGTEVHVDLVVGHVELTLSALADLAPGQVLRTKSKVGDPVALVANGTAHAHGELVDIEGTLGVRVTALL